MRISTASIYTQGGSQISYLQNQVSTSQEKISSGQSYLNPADNPVNASEALVVSQQQGANTQYGTNRQAAETSLNMAGSALSSMTTLLQSVNSLVVSAGNPGLNAADRSNIATQVKNDYNSLLSLANSTDGNGNYLFGGYQNASPPFVSATDASGNPVVQYTGDQGQVMAQVGPNQQVAVSVSGQAMLQSAGTDIFATLNNLSTLLNNNTLTSAQITAGLGDASNGIQQTLNRVVQASATVGSSISQLTQLDNAGSSLDLQYSQSLANLQNLDYAKAITQLTEQTTTLQAAQQSFVKIANLSLFNYIN